MKAAVQAKTTTSVSPAPNPALATFLQRACSCGESGGVSGECAGCESKRRFGSDVLQPKLATGASNGPRELQAGRPHRLLGFSPSEISSAPIGVQLQVDEELGVTADDLDKERGDVAETAETDPEEGTGTPAPISDEEALVLPKFSSADRRHARISGNLPAPSGGHPLEQSTQAAFEEYFQHDFSATRIHADSSAHDFVTEMGALAATNRNHIYFRQGNDRHPWLLAHELTHVVQQRAAPPLGRSNRRLASTGGDLEAEADSAASAFVRGQRLGALGETTQRCQLYRAELCGRPSTQPSDFPNTYINRVDVSLAAQQISLHWTGPNAGDQPTGPYNCSTGAGVRGETSCNNEEHSRAGGSCCTPKGEWRVTGFSCSTSKLGLENFVAFQRAGIGLHYFRSVPRVPASHGCVRLGRRASEIVFDSTRSNLTVINVHGNARGHRRYRSCG